MKTVTISSRSKTVQGLLQKARRNGLILESAQGQRFVLTPLKDWVGYEVGDSRDFTTEVRMTVRNKNLMKHLAERRGHGKSTSIEGVRKELGLK